MQPPTPHNNDEFRCSNVEGKRILYSVAIVLDFIQTVWILTLEFSVGFYQ